MRIVFFGTPEFALPSMNRLLQGRHKVVAVVTQPDRPKKRSTQPVVPPVKKLASSGGIQVLQPEKLSDAKFLGEIQSLHPELAVVVAFGRLIPRSLLQLFPKGAINLHASLLPKYRGAAPLQWALIRGEEETGVTVFQLDEALDHGPILLQAIYPIGAGDTALTLGEALSERGAEILLKAIDLMESGSARPTPQDESLATQAPRLKKEDGIIDWRRGCLAIHNQVRGVQPWPGAMTRLEGKLLKLLLTHPGLERHDPKLIPGTVVVANEDEGLWVQTGKGQLKIDRLQLEGGRILETSAFLRGHPIAPGTKLTP